MHSICSVDKIQSRPEPAADSQHVQIAKKNKVIPAKGHSQCTRKKIRKHEYLNVLL